METTEIVNLEKAVATRNEALLGFNLTLRVLRWFIDQNKESVKIADNMRDYWKNQNAGSEL